MAGTTPQGSTVRPKDNVMEDGKPIVGSGMTHAELAEWEAANAGDPRMPSSATGSTTTSADGTTTVNAGGSSSSPGDGSFDPDRPIDEQIPTPPTSDQPVGSVSPISDQTTHTGQTDDQDIIDAFHQGTMNQLDAAQQNRAVALGLFDDVTDRIDDATGLADDAMSDNERRERIIQSNIDDALENVDKMPDQIMSEFDSIKSEFDADVDASFGRIDSEREAAIGAASFGRSEAMQAAVQGIQGNVNTAIAQINSNPNLSQSQKANMIAGIRLKGASALVPAIGATVAAFNKIEADIAVAFGGYTANLEAVGLSGKAGIATARGSAYAESTIAVQQITGQLLQTSANSAASFANSQSQLLATRTHATMTGSQLQGELLPEMYVPYYDPTGIAQLTHDLNAETALADWQMRSESLSMGINVAILGETEGNPASNIARDAFSGLQSGGPMGMIWGGVLGVVDWLFGGNQGGTFTANNSSGGLFG